MLGGEGKPVNRERLKSTGGMGRLMERDVQGSGEGKNPAENIQVQWHRDLER